MAAPIRQASQPTARIFVQTVSFPTEHLGPRRGALANVTGQPRTIGMVGQRSPRGTSFSAISVYTAVGRPEARRIAAATPRPSSRQTSEHCWWLQRPPPPQVVPLERRRPQPGRLQPPQQHPRPRQARQAQVAIRRARQTKQQSSAEQLAERSVRLFLRLLARWLS